MTIKYKYRGYFVGHSYLSDVQHGIQAAHVIQAMTTKYKNSSSQATEVLSQWTDEDRTMIVLKGGNSAALKAALTRATTFDTQWPVGYFCEDVDSMDGLMTSWGIILPELDRSLLPYYTYSPQEYECGAALVYKQLLENLKTV